jgi:hypothetical protein
MDERLTDLVKIQEEMSKVTGKLNNISTVRNKQKTIKDAFVHQKNRGQHLDNKVNSL